MRPCFFLHLVLLIHGVAHIACGCTTATPVVPVKNQSQPIVSATTPQGTPMKTIGIIEGRQAEGSGDLQS